MPTQALENIKLAIETDTLEIINIENLIKKNPDVVCEKFLGYTLLNYACLRLFQLLPSDESCRTVRFGIFNNSKCVIEHRLNKLNETRDAATHLLRAGATPTETDKTYFMVVLSRFTDHTAFESAFFSNVLKGFRELTKEFLKKGFNYTLPNEFEFNPITSRMKAEELYGFIQWVKEESTQTTGPAIRCES